jgi:glutamine amidotransferase
VRNALEYIGEEAVVTADPGEIERADRLILPGVGAFGDAMANLEARGLPRILYREVIERRKPFLGICLGLQLLAKASAEHGRHAGLGWIDGEVTKFEPTDGRKVPHIGWNDVHRQSPHPLFAVYTDQFCFTSAQFHRTVVTHRVARPHARIPFTAAIARAKNIARCSSTPREPDNGVRC